MHLKFIKMDDNIDVYIVNEGQDYPFDYVKLIEFLYSGENLGDSEYGGDITDQEKSKIDEMLVEINNEVVKKNLEEPNETKHEDNEH